MKIQNSKTISAFGGINFVLEHLENNRIGDLFNQDLPSLANQSVYTWKDIIYSILSGDLCGGDHIEDLQTHFSSNPYVKLASPDTVLRRLKELSVENQQCKTKRGTVEHTYNIKYII